MTGSVVALVVSMAVVTMFAVLTLEDARPSPYPMGASWGTTR